MTVPLDEEEYGRWMLSARRTLESSRRDAEAGDFNWACFKAHQAAEKALKALLWGVGSPVFGHSLVSLVNRLAEAGFEVDERVRELAARLGKFYTPTRCPDVWEEGVPEDYYTRSEAEEAIRQAEEVISWVEAKWKSLRGG
ncbi:MAG: HEPN domain-containing protein [Thermofilaceae archaeon]